MTLHDLCTTKPRAVQLLGVIPAGRSQKGGETQVNLLEVTVHCTDSQLCNLTPLFFPIAHLSMSKLR